MANVGAQLVNPLDPGSIVAQQQLARQQAYADMLRKQSSEPIDYDHKGAISPWQGLTKALQGVGSAFAQGRADSRQLGLATAIQQARAGQFGIGNPTAPPTMSDDPRSGGYSAPRDTSQDGPMMGAGPSAAPPAPPPPPAPSGGATGPVSASPGPPPAPATTDPTAYAGILRDNPPPQAPPPRPNPVTPSQNPNVLPGMTPQQSYELSVYQPEVYAKLREASGTPTDAMKNAGAAYGYGSPQYTQNLGDVTRKAGFIEPTQIREGGAALFNDGSGRVMTSPKTEVGMQNIRDASGNVIRQDNVPGAVEAIGQSEAARAGGKAAGTLPYETVPTFDPATGQTVLTPKADTLKGGYATTAPMGAPEFATTQAKSGAQFFTGLAEGAADAPNRVYALNQMRGMLASGTQFGPGTDAAVKFADFANGIGKAIGYQGNFNGQNVTNVNEFNKWASQYSARAAADLGLSGSDARLNMSVAATPNGHMTNQALSAIIPQMIGFEAAKQGMANAGARYAQAHPGPNAQASFLTQWRGAYDPTVFQITSLPANEQGAAIAKLPPPQRAALGRKWQTLKAMGAF